MANDNIPVPQGAQFSPIMMPEQAAQSDSSSSASSSSLSDAIMQAEGAHPEDNNPGNLSLDAARKLGIPVAGSRQSTGTGATSIAKFPDLETGKKAHQQYLSKFSPDTTFEALAKTYAPGQPNWLKNVTERLGVDKSDKIGPFLTPSSSASGSSEPAASAAAGSVPVPQGAQFAPISAPEGGQEQPASEGLGTFGKIFVGPTTAAGAPLGEAKSQELAGVSDIMQGNVGQGIGAILHAETPHVVQGSPIEKLIQKFKPDFRGSMTPEQAQDLHDKDYAAIDRPAVDVAQTIDKDKHPVLKALTEAAQSMTSPGNVAILASTGGFGMVESPKALAVANRLISTGFTAQAIGQAYKGLKSFKEAYDRGDANEALYQLTHAVTSGTMAYLAGTHAAGAPVTEAAPSTEIGKVAQERVVAPIAEGVGRVGEAVKGAAETVAGTPKAVVSAAKRAVGYPEDFLDAVYKMSPPSKGYAQEYLGRLKQADPQLRQVMRDNPDVGTPEDVFKAIDKHIKQNDAFVASKAAEVEGRPEARMTGIESQVRADLNKAFDENPGQYKPEERDAAVSAVMQHLMQEEPGQLEETKTVREPSLAEAEGVRQRFNQDTKPSFGSNAPSVPAAESFAKKIAANSLRQAIDAKFDQLGVKDVKEWRQQEAPLIDVRDQLADAIKKSKEMGNYNVLHSLIKQFGWRIPVAAMAGAFGGGAEGAAAIGVGGAGLGMAADYFRDLRTNPNRMAETAARMANKPGATGVKLPSQEPVNPIVATGEPALGSQIDLETGKAGEEPKPITGEAIGTLPKAEYKLPTQPAMDIPANRRPSGMFSSDIHRHEWAHATVGHLEGFTPIEIKSHLHPDAKSSNTASTRLTFDGIDKNPDGSLEAESLKRNIPRVISTIMAGAASDELFGAIPFEQNKGIKSDRRAAASKLMQAGFSAEEAQEAIQAGLQRAKEHLTSPQIGDILQDNAKVREDDLAPTHHVSPERMQGYTKELRRIQDENADERAVSGNDRRDVERVGEDNRQDVSGRKEGVPEQRPSGTETEVSTRGLREHTTGDVTVDTHIKSAGAIPAGSMGDLALFHDPKTGSTLALGKSDVTPELVRQHLDESRKTFGVKTELATGKEEKSPNLDEYHEKKGLPPVDLTKIPLDKAEGAKIADEYDAMQHNPNDPKVKAAYDALKSETKAQWKELQKQGMTMSVVDKDPYTSAEDAIRDIRENHHIAVWSGEGDMPKDHPLREIDPETGLSYNSIFRAVHDVLGHGVGNNDFSEQGEENAYNLHKQSYSREAIPALATETRGQANWFFNNKDVRESGAEPNAFPTQKAALLPDELHRAPQDWHLRAAETVKNQPAGAINPRINSFDKTGYGTEIYPEVKQRLDHQPTAKDFKNFEKSNQEVLNRYPELRVGWDKDPKLGWELNIGSRGEDQAATVNVAKKLDQRSAFDIAKGDEILTGGKNLKTDFSDYPLAQRMADLRGKPVDLETGREEPEEGDTSFAFGANAPAQVIESKPYSVETSQRVSSRFPTAVSATEDPMQHDLTMDSELIHERPKVAQALSDKIVQQNKSMVFTPEEQKTPKGVFDSFVRQAKDNIKFMYNQASPENQTGNRVWYDGAHVIGVNDAKANDLEPRQNFAAIATQSPQKDWDQNVSLYERLLDMVKNKSDIAFTPEMNDKANDFVREIAKTNAKKKAAGKPEVDPWVDRKLINKLKGKSLEDLSDPVERAAWARLYDEAHNPREFQEIAPDGTKKGVKMLAGTDIPEKVAWGGLNSISKGLSVLQDGSLENISKNLGENHKIRSFYNNIAEPNSPHEDVTADTHHVGLSLMRPIAGDDAETKLNFGGNGSTITGLHGTYPLYVEATRQAMREINAEHPDDPPIEYPRQLQSVVWVEWRNMFPPEARTVKTKAAVDSIWKEHLDGKITADEARQQVAEYAGRLRSGVDAEEQRPSDQAELFGNQLHGAGNPAGGGPGTAAGTPLPARRPISAKKAATAAEWLNFVKSGVGTSAGSQALEK